MPRKYLFFFTLISILSRAALSQPQCHSFYQNDPIKDTKIQSEYAVESLSVAVVQSRWLKNNRVVTLTSSANGPVGSVSYTRNHYKMTLNFESVKPRAVDIENMKNASAQKLSHHVTKFFKDNSDLTKRYGNVVLATGTLHNKTGLIAVTMAKNGNGHFASGLSWTLGGAHVGNQDFTAIIILRVTDIIEVAKIYELQSAPDQKDPTIQWNMPLMELINDYIYKDITQNEAHQ